MFRLLQIGILTRRRNYTDVKKFKEDYASGVLHPGDVKPALAKALNKLLQPVRDHFTNVRLVAILSLF